MLTRLNTGPLPSIATKLQHLALGQIDQTTGSERSAMRGPPPSLAGFVDLDTSVVGLVVHPSDSDEVCLIDLVIGDSMKRNLHVLAKGYKGPWSRISELFFEKGVFCSSINAYNTDSDAAKVDANKGHLSPVGIVFLHLANNKKCNSSL